MRIYKRSIAALSPLFDDNSDLLQLVAVGFFCCHISISSNNTVLKVVAVIGEHVDMSTLKSDAEKIQANSGGQADDKNSGETTV